MLLEMKRDAARCGEEDDDKDSGKHSSTLLGSQLRFGDDPETDSSDDDTSTFKSPVCVGIFGICINCHKCERFFSPINLCN